MFNELHSVLGSGNNEGMSKLKSLEKTEFSDFKLLWKIVKVGRYRLSLSRGYIINYMWHTLVIMKFIDK